MIPSDRLHLLFPLARRSESFISPSVHVEVYLTGIIRVDIQEVSPRAWLQFTVQVSHDEQRWAERLVGPRWAEPNSYEISVENFGMYLRVSYELTGPITFGATFRGLLWGESPGDMVS